MTSFQSLSSGANPIARPASRYGELGGFQSRMFASPVGVRGFIAGLPGSGKSSFFQTCPDAFIFNLDLSSTAIPIIDGKIPEPKAVSWPGISYEGHSLDDNGQPFVLTWPAVRAKIDLLCRLAKENKPRPRLVVVDSLTACVRLLREWMPGQAAALGIAGEAKDTWKQLDGRAAWDILYDLVVGIMERLSSHGYGFYFVGHVINAKIPLGEDRFVFKPELTITDGFWKRLYDKFELVLLCEKKQEPVMIPDPRDPRRKIAGTVTRTYLTTGGVELSGLTKTRVLLDAIPLEPADDAWNVFRTAYEKAARISSPSSPSTT